MAAETHFIHNPYGHDLWCEVIDEIVQAGKSVEATVEQVAEATRTGIFRTFSTRGENGPELVDVPAGTVAKKATVKRGTKTVETTAAAPEVETR